MRLLRPEPQAIREGLSRTRAFTLTEMLVVLAIIGLVTVMALPAMMPFIRGRRVSQAVEVVRSGVMRARYLAVQNGARYSVWFIPYNDHDPEGVTSNKVEIWATGGTAPIEEPLYLPPPVRLYLGAFTPVITFTPSGAADAGTNIGGFHLVGAIAATSKVKTASNATLTVKASNANWATDQWREHVIVISNMPNPVTKTVSPAAGRCRRIRANTADELILYNPWNETGEDPAVVVPLGESTPGKNDGDVFFLVAPENVRRVVVYASTGRVRAEAPR